MSGGLCRSPIELLAFADEYACADYTYLKNLPQESQAAVFEELFTDDNAAIDCHELEGVADAGIPVPETNAEIWLRNSSEAPVRGEIYEEFKDDLPYSSHLSIQGGGGAATRLPLVIVIALGLLGGILLLAFLAIKLITQSAVAFALLLAAPLALFLPAFGERGRNSFVYWATTLVGAILSKVVYAALLAIVLAATNVASSLAGDDGGIGTMAAFLVSSGLWWAVFLKRDTILGFISVGSQDGDGRMLQNLVGMRAAQQMGGAALGKPFRAAGWGKSAAAGAAGAAGGAFLGRREDRDEGTRAVAENQLEQTAERRLDGQYDAARETLDSHGATVECFRDTALQEQGARKELGELRRKAPGEGASPAEHEAHQVAVKQKAAQAAELGRNKRELSQRMQASEPAASEAKAFVGNADSHAARTGRRWSAEHLSSAQEALRREADRPAGAPEHAWRAGMSPERYAALEGPQRDVVHGQVENELRRDRAALGTISDRPPGAVGEPPTDRAGARQLRKEIRASGDREIKRELRDEREAHKAIRTDNPRRGDSDHRRPRGPSRRNISGR